MGILKKAVAFLTGGAADAGLGLANGVSDIIERWHPGDAKQHEMGMEIASQIEASIANARKHDLPMNSGVPWLDGVVNGINRLIRPWITITVVGSLFGYWDLPPPDTIDPHYWSIGTVIIGFWFGGRAVFKDLPAAIKTFRRFKNKENK